MNGPSINRPMTEKQQLVLNFLIAFIAKNGFPPSRTEISKNFGWASSNAAQECLISLARKRKIRLMDGIARGIKVME